MNTPVCRTAAIALTGIEGTLVQVEAAISNQLPGMVIIGLPDAALAEAKQRVKVATQQAGMPVTNRFLCINLSPAALPKQGSGFDLAIALSALAASDRLPAARLSQVAHIGELGLDGELRRPPGLLSAVLAAKRLGFAQVMVPVAAAREASLVPGVEIIAVESLIAAVAWHRGESSTQTHSAATSSPDGTHREADTTRGAHTESADSPHQTLGQPDVSHIIGQPEAVAALTVAAAGRHHLSLVGPPGAGKTLLATSLATILPDLDPAESLTASSITSLGGAPLTSLVRRPPFEHPHHTASKVAIIGGGGAAGVQPGAITRACHGVLFLDEAPEFARGVLDALRQPLESGSVEIHRANVRATLPARTQLVLAANPCPCGNADALDGASSCRCSPGQRVRYLARISGPLTDRIDLRLQVRRVTQVFTDLDVTDAPRVTSAQLRQRVAAARNRAQQRLKNTPWLSNGEVRGDWLRAPSNRLPRSSTAALDNALARGALTLRGYDRVLRISWTLADLAGKPRPERAEVRQAIALRTGSA